MAATQKKVQKKNSKALKNDLVNRVNFGRITPSMDLPNLIEVQKRSFQRFLDEGIKEVFKSFEPIVNNAKNMELTFEEFQLETEIAPSIEECRAKDKTYEAPLFVLVRLVNKETGEITEQQLFMGNLPLMTSRGTFIVNGTERVVVSQLVRSPGVYFSHEQDSGVEVYKAQFIPSRGAWLEFEIDKHGKLVVSIDRKRRQNATLLLKALGIAENNDKIQKLLGDSDVVLNTLASDSADTQEEALLELYKRQRPGEPPSVEAARTLIDGLFFNAGRYDLARVGRYKINKKLGLKEKEDVYTLTKNDIVAALQYLLALAAGDKTKSYDDIDHFGNRRVRTVGELVKNQLRIGVSRMERVVRERMAGTSPEDLVPQKLINATPIDMALKEFFGSSQLSQFMDQANPLSGLTHKRRLSALGPGGLAGHKSGNSRRTNVPTAVRDVHNSHYARMCPIETPEGPNIGLIGSLALYARVNDYGFIEAPYRKVENGKVTDKIDWMTADEEEKHVIAPADQPVDEKTGHFVEVDPKTGKMVPAERIIARTTDFDGTFGAPDEVSVTEVDYVDVSPRQLLSVAGSLIPFLEHDDAKRTLMGANMQRQAVPLIKPEAPYVGTGLEFRAALDSGEVPLAKHAGTVESVDAAHVVVKTEKGTDEYKLEKYARSNQGTCINYHPIVQVGQKIKEGEPLADSTSVCKTELALGANLTVAYMPWEGYNYEDGIVVSERVVQEDLLTSISISRHEIDARDMGKTGQEEITREIPNLSEAALANLDEDGIIRIGAEVGPGDILVGKVTPKGENAPTSEERLLQAIFSTKANDVRDTSLRMPHGAYGQVVDVKRFIAGDRGEDGHEDLGPDVKEMVRVYVAQRRKIQEGDKISGRHGNKGVICKVLPVEDMPYMSDGTPIDVLLNPLGVPSRMNVGQLMECHLGWCAKQGWDIASEKSTTYVPGPMPVSTPVFDGATASEVEECLKRTNTNLMNKARELYGDKMMDVFVPQLNSMGKTTLYDGRTGEAFREPVTVGTSYILKLGHMVDDKIHARSTGPYSLITQQPLGGKAQFGGQRFGEMEVWALYAYGAANVLQELLTVKSDDSQGRVKAYESIIKGESLPEAGIPEAFHVLIKEIRSLALNIEPLRLKMPKVVEPIEVAEQSAEDVVDLFSEAFDDTDEKAEDIIEDLLDVEKKIEEEAEASKDTVDLIGNDSDDNE